LNIIKYEKPIDPLTNGDAKGGFPTHLISISDEDNLLSYPEVLDELQEGEVLNVTTKSDGSSTTFSFEADGTFRACSRRQELKEGTGFPWKIEKKYNLQAKMRGLGYPLVIQGEAVGPGLNGNRLELKEPEFHLFRAKDLVNYNQLSNFELKELAEVLGVPVVKSVMVIHFIKNVHTVEFFRNLADSILYDNGKPGEGIVISPETPKHSHVLNKNWSVKVINNYYKQ
jgi:hypothetical protein